MTKTWLWGIFGDGRGDISTDGSTAVDNILTVGLNTDSVAVDVTGRATATLNISRSDLPENWKTQVLVTGYTMLALVDGDTVLFAGYLNKINSNMNGSVTLVVNGLKDYVARQQVNDTYGVVITDPKAATTFTGLGYTGLLQSVISKCFSMADIPEDAPKPANVLGDFIAVNGDTVERTYKSLHSGAETYGTIVENISASLSRWGVEVQYIPRWEDVTTKTRIVWDVVIGNDALREEAHIKQNELVELDASQVVDGFSSLTSLELTYSVEEIANRYVAQSRYGDRDNGVEADITTKVKENSGLPRFDSAYNPEAMLNTAEMDERLTTFLDTQLDSSTASLEILEDWTTDWLTRLGFTVKLMKSQNEETAEAFEMLVRCTGVSFSASTSRVTITIQPLLPRFITKKNKNKQPIKPATGSASQPLGPVFTISQDRPKLSEKKKTYTDNLPQPLAMAGGTGWHGAGLNHAGQLGVDTDTETALHTEVKRGGIPDGLDIVEIFGQSHISHAVMSDGSVYGWGERMEALGVDGCIENLKIPQRAEWFGPTPIKKIAYPTYETVIALTADGSEILQIAIGDAPTQLQHGASGFIGIWDAGLFDYTWDNPPAPIIDIAAGFDVVYAVLNDGTLWAKGNSVFMGIGAFTPEYIPTWTRCTQNSGALGNIKSIHVLDAPATEGGHVRVVVAVSNTGGLYRINTSPENDWTPQRWFELTVLSGVEQVGLAIKGLYYRNGTKLFHRTFADLEEDTDLVDFSDVSEFRDWKDFSVWSGWRQEIAELATETVIAVTVSGSVFARGYNEFGELGTGDKEEYTGLTSLELDMPVTSVRALAGRTLIRT
jgi:alpha-tubulin suppressor-like RCC1 family protein